MNANNYGEPWKLNLNADAVPITRADGTEVLGNCEINESDLIRAVTCVNECAGIDPAAAIQAAMNAIANAIDGMDPDTSRHCRQVAGEISIGDFIRLRDALKLLTPSKQ